MAVNIIYQNKDTNTYNVTINTILTDKYEMRDFKNNIITIVNFPYLWDKKIKTCTINENTLKYIDSIYAFKSIEIEELSIDFSEIGVNSNINYLCNMNNIPNNIKHICIYYNNNTHINIQYDKRYNGSSLQIYYPSLLPFLNICKYLNNFTKIETLTLNIVNIYQKVDTLSRNINNYIDENWTSEYISFLEMNDDFILTKCMQKNLNKLTNLKVLKTNLIYFQNLQIEEIINLDLWNEFPQLYHVEYNGSEYNFQIIKRPYTVTNNIKIENSINVINDRIYKIESALINKIENNNKVISNLKSGINFIHKKNDFKDVYNISHLYSDCYFKYKNEYSDVMSEFKLVYKFQVFNFKLKKQSSYFKNELERKNSKIQTLEHSVKYMYKKSDFKDVYIIYDLYTLPEYPSFSYKEEYNTLLLELKLTYKMIINMYNNNRKNRILQQQNSELCKLVNDLLK